MKYLKVGHGQGHMSHVVLCSLLLGIIPYYYTNFKAVAFCCIKLLLGCCYVRLLIVFFQL